MSVYMSACVGEFEYMYVCLQHSELSLLSRLPPRPRPHTLPGHQRRRRHLPSKRHLRADPDPNDWAALLAFAHRTYAPATEESRLRGAGAGLSDND